jgi:hypothetical protein
MAVSIFLGCGLKQAMARGAILPARKFFVGEASSLDHRGREAASTEHDPTFLEAGILDMSGSLHF